MPGPDAGKPVPESIGEMTIPELSVLASVAAHSTAAASVDDTGLPWTSTACTVNLTSSPTSPPRDTSAASTCDFAMSTGPGATVTEFEPSGRNRTLLNAPDVRSRREAAMSYTPARVVANEAPYVPLASSKVGSVD